MMKNLKLIIEKEDEEAWQGTREPKERRYKRFREEKMSHHSSLNKRKSRFRSDWEEE